MDRLYCPPIVLLDYVADVIQLLKLKEGRASNRLAVVETSEQLPKCHFKSNKIESGNTSKCPFNSCS